MSVATSGSRQDALFELGPWRSACGRERARRSPRLPGLSGSSNADRSNLVLTRAPTALPEDIDWWWGPILDPRRFCVLLVSQ